MIRSEICCVGDFGIDEYVELSREMPGGCAFNVATAARAAAPPDMNVSLVAPLGEDGAGDKLAALISSQKIDARISRVSGMTPRQKIKLGHHGERELCGYEAGVLADWRPDAAQCAAIENAGSVVTVAFTQVMPLFEHVLALPRRGGMFVDFMDLSDFRRSAAAIAPYIAKIDGAFFGLKASEDERLIAQLAAMAHAEKKTFVVTLGAIGSVCFDGDGAHTVPAVAAKPRELRDSTGAGDAYAGTFLAARVSGASIRDAMLQATEAGTATVKHFGATPFSF